MSGQGPSALPEADAAFLSAVARDRDDRALRMLTGMISDGDGDG